MSDEGVSKDQVAESLLRDREIGHGLRRFYLEQRDDFTTKYRLLIGALNGASLVTVLSEPFRKLLEFKQASEVMAPASFFLVGMVATGLSLYFHQNHLIRMTGEASRLANLTDDASLLIVSRLDTASRGRLALTLEQIAKLSGNMITMSNSALWAQGIGSGSWLGGAAALVFHVVRL